MNPNLLKRFFVFLITVGSLAMVTVACSSDDGPEEPKVVDPTADPTNENTTITADPTSVDADGTSLSTVTVTIADSSGTQLTTSAGAVSLSSSSSTSTVSAVTDNSDGTYTATVMDTVAGTVTISGTLGEVAITDTAEIIFVGDTAAADPANANTTIEGTEVDSTGTSTVTVQLANSDGELLAVSGGTVALTGSGSATLSEVTDNGDGSYTATVTDTVAETVTISGTLDEVAITDTAEIIFGEAGGPNPAQEAEQSTEPAGPSLLRINSGGPEVTFGDVTFLEDQYFTGPTEAYTNPLVTEIAETEMDALYLTERVTADDTPAGPFSYEIPVSNGIYTVKLYFAEIFWGIENPEGFEGDVGSRVFSISMEDTPIFTDYDLFRDVGAETADQRMYDIEVTDGVLNITFEASVDRPKVSAIEIFGEGTIGG